MLKSLLSNFFHLVMKVENYLFPEYCGLVDRRRIVAFLLLTVCEAFIVIFHFSLFTILREYVGLTMTAVHFVLLVILQYMVWARKMDVAKGVGAIFLLSTVKMAVDCVMATYYGHPNDNVSVMNNIFIMFVLACTALSLLLNKVSLTITTIITIVVICFFTCKPGFFTLFSAKALFVGYMMNFYVIFYNQSNIKKGLRNPEKVAIDERKALEMLADLHEKSDDVVGGLINRLTPDVRRRVMMNVAEHLKKEQMANTSWENLCPDLTKSEIEICKLVLKGMSLKEICAELNKSESNITSQRCHIRKKLQMEKDEDLKTTLEKRLGELRGGKFL